MAEAVDLGLHYHGREHLEKKKLPFDASGQ